MSDEPQRPREDLSAVTGHNAIQTLVQFYGVQLSSYAETNAKHAQEIVQLRMVVASRETELKAAKDLHAASKAAYEVREGDLKQRVEVLEGRLKTVAEEVGEYVDKYGPLPDPECYEAPEDANESTSTKPRGGSRGR